MGSYMIFDMEFKEEKDIKLFDKYLEQKNINRRKLTPYHEKGENQMFFIIYYVGYLGYGEPYEILKDCLKNKIGIKFMAWLPISDRESEWEKIRGRW